MYSIRKTEDLAEVVNLNSIIFPQDLLDVSENVSAWIIYNADKHAVGFCTASNLGHGILFLSRAGLLPEHTGNGLHRRSIRHRISYARRYRYSVIITYVRKDNWTSFCNLIREGFKLYEPEYDYAGKDFLYLMYELKD